MIGQLNKKCILLVWRVHTLCTSCKGAAEHFIIAKAILQLRNNVTNEDSAKVRLPAVELLVSALIILKVHLTRAF